MPGGWSEMRPADAAWRPSLGLSQADRRREQDEAAGGHDNRVIKLANGQTATASICLRLPPKARRLYAYLRWSADGETEERYVGEVRGSVRRDNLAEAWRMARERGLSEAHPALPPAAAPKDSWASSPAVRAVMRANKNKDTKPELRLRSAVHGLGLRYRVGTRPLPSVRRTADLVFSGAKVAVFVDGCFWHGCPEHHRPAKRNSEFWTAKITGNRDRDRETDRKLAEAGWVALRIWEHEDPGEAAKRVAEQVRARSPRRRRRGAHVKAEMT
ncbi:very short patch repair endonuclease [Spirillospora sp. CA-294931]|uniref:very short patch repair endonuclease n=1 Tax=Spirillospora sp. CA-294931 TaxID=3240042 RepID=UPI003D9100BC